MRTVEELRELIVKEHNSPLRKKDCGEILSLNIHIWMMTFKEVAKLYNITLDELAEVIADHIRKL